MLVEPILIHMKDTYFFDSENNKFKVDNVKIEWFKKNGISLMY